MANGSLMTEARGASGPSLICKVTTVSDAVSRSVGYDSNLLLPPRARSRAATATLNSTRLSTLETLLLIFLHTTRSLNKSQIQFKLSFVSLQPKEGKDNHLIIVDSGVHRWL